MKKKDKPADPEAAVRNRAQAIVDRRYSLGDDALLLEAAQSLARIAVRLLEGRHEDDEAALAHARKLVDSAEEIADAWLGATRR
jgi:hypothetical protein